MLRRLVAAEETERGRVSRELHDRLGQDLTALKLGLQIVRKQAALPAGGAGQRQQAGRTGRPPDAGHPSPGLGVAPAALDDFGLEMALRRYADEWAALSGVPVDFHSQGMNARRLAPEIETTLYRITREALTNVFRHAKARRVSVLVERRAEQVSLIVEDDGQGFDAGATLGASTTEGKLGLLGMQERATLAGGSLEIESSPGAGTTVFVRLPLASTHDEEAAHSLGRRPPGGPRRAAAAD